MSERPEDAPLEPPHPDAPPEDAEPPDGAAPETPDQPLGVPADGADEDLPGFQRDAPNAG